MATCQFLFSQEGLMETMELYHSLLLLLLLLQPLYGLFSKTTWVSRHQKGKTNLDFTGARDSEWQWHQLGHMQVCISLCLGLPRWAICKSAPCPRQITTPAPHHSIFYRPDALPAALPIASKHWRQPAADIMFKNWQLNRNLNCQATAAAAAERGQQ